MRFFFVGRFKILLLKNAPRCNYLSKKERIAKKKGQQQMVFLYIYLDELLGIESELLHLIRQMVVNFGICLEIFQPTISKFLLGFLANPG